MVLVVRLYTWCDTSLEAYQSYNRAFGATEPSGNLAEISVAERKLLAKLFGEIELKHEMIIYSTSTCVYSCCICTCKWTKPNWPRKVSEMKWTAVWFAFKQDKAYTVHRGMWQTGLLVVWSGPFQSNPVWSILQIRSVGVRICKVWWVLLWFI